MRRLDAIAVLVALLALTTIALSAPWPAAVLLVVGALFVMSRRGAFLLLVGSSIVINALILGIADGWARGAVEGAIGGARLAAALGVNLAMISRVGAARLLDGLRLPPRAATLAAAVLLAAQDVGRDFVRLREARRLEGEKPDLLSAARLLPGLFVLAERRANARRDALFLAGHATSRRFVPIVVVASLAAAGRLALLALPNVKLTFVVVFLGGVLYGPLVGAMGGIIGMALTDMLFSGLYPLAFVNAPAMALVGLAGATLRRVDWEGDGRIERWAGLSFAFAAGVIGTLIFSVASDSLTWLVVAPTSRAAWIALVIAGLAFNVIPAIANGMLFALSVRPVVGAFRRLREGGPTARAPMAPASRVPSHAASERPPPAALSSASAPR